MSAAAIFEKWADFGLADVITFDRLGQVKDAHCGILSGIAAGDDIFEKLPVLRGCEDLFETESSGDYPLSLQGVSLIGRDIDTALDFRIGRDRSGSEGYVLVSPAAGRTGTAEKLIQERRRARHLQDQIDKERLRFERIYRRSPIIAFAVNEKRQLIAMTEKLEHWIGSSMPFHSWVSDFIASIADKPVEARSAEAQGSLIVPVSIAGTGVALVHVFFDDVTVLDGQNHRYYVLENVTHLYAAYQTAERQRKELELRTHDVLKSNMRLQQFAHLAAHDLLGPVGRIASFAELIEHKMQGAADSIVPTALNAIRVSAVESVAVVRELLALAQLEASKPLSEPIDLDAILNQVTRHQSFSDPVKVRIEKLCSILGDHRLVSLILRNLISNSYKYRAQGRELEIIVRVEPVSSDFARLSVSDNGRGFKATSQNVFAAFERMATHNDIEGTGLGLFLVRDAAASMGWKAGIEATQGVGTEVQFTAIRQVCA